MTRLTTAGNESPAEVARPRCGTGGPEAAAARELLILDHTVPDAGMLSGMAARPCRAVRLAADADGLAALAMVVQAFGPVSAVHLVGHGGPGRLDIGTRQITRDSLARRPEAAARLAAALGGAPLLLYGCAVGAGGEGGAFTEALAAALDAPVRAASAPVGAAALGGAWTLDVAAPAEHAPAVPPLFDAAGTAGWPHLLVTTRWIGGTGDWTTVGNWDNGVPTAADIADINNGGTAQLTAAAAADLVAVGDNIGPGTLEISAGGTLTSSIGTLAWDAGSAGTVTVDGVGSTWTATSITVGGSGIGTLTVSDGGTVSLPTFGLNLGVFSGATGTLNIGDGGSAGILDASGVECQDGTAILNFNHTDAGHYFTSDGTAGGTAVVITGSTAVNQVGSGTTILTGANTYTGGTTVGAGTLSVAADGNLGTGAVTLDGGTLAITGATTIDNDFVFGTGHGTVSADGADSTISGDISGPGRLIKQGAGTLTLTGTNSYDGDTWLGAGTLSVADDDNLGDGAVALYGGTLDLTGATDIDNDLVFYGNSTVSADGADGTISGAISGSSSRSLTKSGAGMLTFSGTSTYSGTTTVSAGTLVVIGSIANSATTVASGATLGGSGTLGAVSVASGGALTPGNSPGTITTGDLTLATGATLTVEIDGTAAGSQYDQIDVTGTVDLGGATLATVFGYTSTSGTSFVLIDNDGTLDPVTGSFSGLAEGASFTSGGRTYRISYAAGDGNDVVLTDVTPAPPSGPANLSLTGTPAADVLVGGDGDDTVWALASGDTASGAAGADLIYGNQGGDTLWAGDGADTVYGGQHDDAVYGNPSGDVLFGNRGADFAHGGQGADLLYGNQNADTLAGGIDADTLFGGQGDDVVYGNQGEDVLYGNLGADTLYGGQGADTLSGGAGDDRLVGNLGADRYAFGSGDGADTVEGFSLDEADLIAVAANVNGTGVATAADLLARLTADAEGNAVLDLGDGTTVTLIGVPPASLTAADFLLF